MEVNGKKFEELINLIEDLVINKIRLEKINNEYEAKELNQVLSQEILTTSLIQDIVKKITMVPISTLFAKIEKSSKEFISNTGKNIEVEFVEDKTEIDNSILEHVEIAINYFIKTSCENGFKDKNGVIRIITCSDFNNAIIEIKTDFSSVNDEAGLQEVKNSIGNIGGSIEVSEDEDNFTLIKINIPVSSTITQAMIITINGQNYAIPNSYIETIMNKGAVTIKKHGSSEVALYREHAIPFIRVANKLNINVEEDNANCIVIVKVGEKNAALLVDSILDQTDLVVKAKPSVIKDVKEFKGTTILSDGMVTLILDIPALIH